MRLPSRAQEVLKDLEGAPNAGEGYPNVWGRFGSFHIPPSGKLQTEADAVRAANETAQVLVLLKRLPERTAYTAIEGITVWLSAWSKMVAVSPMLGRVWLRLWPLAVEATNSQQQKDEAIDLNTVATSPGDDEPMDLDTLNTPAGRMVGVLLEACPEVKVAGDRPFATNGSLRAMRDAAIQTDGRAGLITRSRMVEHLGYFLSADPEWTQDRLISPLEADTEEAIPLWRALARDHRPSRKLIEVIGELMVQRATDLRLGRETRQSLVWKILVESLEALRESRTPAIAHARVQQMLRSVDDEARVFGAQLVQRFVRDVSNAPEEYRAPPEDLFYKAAQPFLERVWPLDRSLTTPGIARAFAGLPAVCGEAFSDALKAIDRFLVPFECWSMLDYGLFGEQEGKASLSRIDTLEKATALLQLLDRTIGTAERSVVPVDLGSALEQVRTVAPRLLETARYRRLATLTRR